MCFQVLLGEKKCNKFCAVPKLRKIDYTTHASITTDMKTQDLSSIIFNKIKNSTFVQLWESPSLKHWRYLKQLSRSHRRWHLNGTLLIYTERMWVKQLVHVIPVPGGSKACVAPVCGTAV